MQLSSMKYSGTSVLVSRQAVSSAIGTSRASSISRPCLSVGRSVAAKGSKFAPARELAVCAKRGFGSEFGGKDPYHDETDFERETQVVLTRVLTARATQLVLCQLNVDSPQVFEWLTNFTRECPPIEGNDFVLKLMKRQPCASIDPVTKNTMIIHPVTLAQQVLAVRDELAEVAAKGLPQHVKNSNLNVIKTHLDQNHYTLSHKVNRKRGSVRQSDGQAQHSSS